MLQSCVSLSLPSQLAPPFSGAGFVQVLVSRILPFGPEGPKWQDCFDTFCARAQKVQNKGWRSTA